MGKSTPNWRTFSRFLGILAYKSRWLLNGYQNLQNPLATYATARVVSHQFTGGLAGIGKLLDPCRSVFRYGITPR